MSQYSEKVNTDIFLKEFKVTDTAIAKIFKKLLLVPIKNTSLRYLESITD